MGGAVLVAPAALATPKAVEVTVSNLSPISVYVTTPAVRIVERAQAADLPALVNYLVASGAEHRGRLGFMITRNGEECRMVFERDGIQWSWRYIEAAVLPLFERARRLASVPRVKPIGRKASDPISERWTVKAHAHQVFPTRFEVASESGKRYAVAIRPGCYPSITCDCQDGQTQAARGRNARCSHAAAVLREQQTDVQTVV